MNKECKTGGVLVAVPPWAALISAWAMRTIRSKTNSFTNLLMILLLAITGICLARDLFTLYAFMEITGLASFTMIAIYREDESLEGAFKYLTLSCVAGAFILAGLSFLFMARPRARA